MEHFDTMTVLENFETGWIRREAKCAGKSLPETFELVFAQTRLLQARQQVEIRENACKGHPTTQVERPFCRYSNN